MKTLIKKDDAQFMLRIPETIIWVIAVFVSIFLFFATDLFGQESDKYSQDTLWLKTGEIIPCKINSDNLTTKIMSFTARNEKGMIVHNQLPKENIQSFKISNNAIENIPAYYKIEMKDGTILTGEMISGTETQIELFLADIGTITILKNKISKIIPLDASRIVQKSFWPENPNTTRLFFAPTAIPLKQGEGYYQNIYVVGNIFSVGVLDNLSVGAGFDFITMFSRNEGEWNPMLNFNFKSGFKVAEHVHIGVGGMYLTIINQFSTGILYGLGTFGSDNSNFTSGVGWGFVNGQFEPKPFMMLGGMARVSEKMWFISENWIAPIDAGSYYLLISYGMRFASNKIAVDLAFINNQDIFENILFIGIPYVDFIIKFVK